MTNKEFTISRVDIIGVTHLRHTIYKRDFVDPTIPGIYTLFELSWQRFKIFNQATHILARNKKQLGQILTDGSRFWSLVLNLPGGRPCRGPGTHELMMRALRPEARRLYYEQNIGWNFTNEEWEIIQEAIRQYVK